jgi:TPR repeat protein
LVGEALEKIRSRYFPKSEDAVLDLWRNAVAGYPDAQNEVSELLFIGGVVPQDSTRAAYWCRQAADQGDAFAQCSVGILYEHGDGVPQDYAEAMKWYRKAADQGDPSALSNLGTLSAARP